jgi:hypothetical protein
MSDLSKIQKRHADIPQDSLLGLEEVDAGTALAPVKRKTAKTAGYAVCPSHRFERTARNDGKTSLVRDADGELVFREHTKRVGSMTLRCPGSGVAPEVME